MLACIDGDCKWRYCTYYMLAAVLIEVIVVSGGIVPHAGGCVDGDGKRWNCTTCMT
jgi:hypothetical protein